MKKLTIVILITIASAGIYAFKTSSKKDLIPAVNLANFDTKIRPQDDFYQFVNGGWLKNNPCPPSESRWGAFSEVQERNYIILRSILESAAANNKAAKGSNEQKIGDFYASGMDSAKLNRDGMKPIKSDMEQIKKITTIGGIAAYIGWSSTTFSNPVFRFYAAQDAKNSTQVVPQADQGGLGLPDRDYYFKDDDKSKRMREEYKKYMINMFKLSGEGNNEAEKSAAAVYKMEEKLAYVSLTRVQRRNPELTYNKKSNEELNKLAPAFDWKIFYSEAKIPATQFLILENPKFIERFNEMLMTSTIDDWKAFFKWNLLRDAAPFLSDEWINESFNFNEKTVKGTKENKPRWKRVLQTVDGSMGEALGQLYCEKAFNAETKKRCLIMVNNLGEALKKSIDQLEWMSGETKKSAQLKLSMIMNKIGYPDQWKDYSPLAIDRTSYYANATSASEFAYQYMINKIGKPVNRHEWMMSPPTVNAYYNPTMNEIVFPAGILQPPFFNANADDAVNYGGMGSVIGHELTHGFDDQGCQFDAHGNLSNWWTKEDSIKFAEKAGVIVQQYNNSVVLDSLHVNGELTLGENIADIGGLKIAYAALKLSRSAGSSSEKLDGFTPEQRFFIGWAQVWRNNIREEELRRRLIMDPHSPGKLRCNVPLSNLPEFYEAFGVKAGDKMFRPENERARIW